MNTLLIRIMSISTINKYKVKQTLYNLGKYVGMRENGGNRRNKMPVRYTKSKKKAKMREISLTAKG